MAQSTQPAAPRKPAEAPYGSTQPAAAPEAPEKPDVPAMRDPVWVARHKGFVAQAGKAGADVLFLGDSITDSLGKTAVWRQYYVPLKALNFGIAGDRTQHVLWRITNGELEGIKPKAVVIMIGTNNSGSDSIDAIAAGVKAIVTTVRIKLPETKVLLLAIFPRAKEAKNPARAKLVAVNEQLAKLDDGKNVKFLDIALKFLEADGSISKAIMPDSLHLSPKGYEIWAEAMNPTLRELLGQKIEKEPAVPPKP